MSPAYERLLGEARGFPRVSGDEPHQGPRQVIHRPFSPRERG